MIICQQQPQAAITLETTWTWLKPPTQLLLTLLLQIADAIGIDPSLARSLKSGLLTAILAISICGFTIMALVLLQGLWRLTHKSLMWGECCCSCSE
jgi:hypothetical protein